MRAFLIHLLGGHTFEEGLEYIAKNKHLTAQVQSLETTIEIMKHQVARMPKRK